MDELNVVTALSPMRMAIEIACKSDGVATRRELRAAGIGDATIHRWIKNGFLRPIHRGVYLVGGAPLTIRAELRAATARGGPNAHVAEIGALYLGRATDRPPANIVLLSSSNFRDFDDITMKRSESFPEEERTHYSGIRCTTVARAIVDLSAHHPSQRLVRWMRNAEFHKTLRLDDVRAAEHRLAPRGHGTVLREALLKIDIGHGGTDSVLEDILQSLMIAAELPDPIVGALMPGVLKPNERVDFLFREFGLVVEADGPHHLEPMQRSTDHRRDAQLRAAGYEVLRFWWYEIEREPVKVIATIRAMLHARCHMGVS